tara:strand:- start:1554 stop:1808 length:255 start_codon:yes stop_codon:yes gene_type:complete
MYSVGLPQIEEKVCIGNEFYGINVLVITTTDSYNHTRVQKESRIKLYPVELEYSHFYKYKIEFGIRIFGKRINIGLEYGKSEKY